MCAGAAAGSVGRVDDDLIIERSPLPHGIDPRLVAQLGFLAEADKLKTILRASPLAAVDRRENDAEHSWHLALMVMLLGSTPTSRSTSAMRCAWS